MYYLTRKGKGFFSEKLYRGEKKQNKRNGFGIQFFPNGCVYLGEWVNNIAEGKGIFIIKDSTSYKGTFKKNFIKTGQINYFNGAKYEGTFDSTPFERFKNGTFIFKSGYKFTGEWKEGLPKQGHLYNENKKVGEISNSSNNNYICSNGVNGVFISKTNKWMYEGGLEQNECNGDGIIYCTFQQYKMGVFKDNKTNGAYYKMSINWGEISDGQCKMDKKIGKIKKMFNNGYFVVYNSSGGKASVTFPYLNDDKFEGSVKFDKSTFSVILRKGVYTCCSDGRNVSIDVYNVSDIFSIKEVQAKGVDFDFLLSKFLAKEKVVKKLKDYMEELYKSNVIVDITLLPSFLDCTKANFNKDSRSSSKKKISNNEMDKFIRAKYRSEMKKKRMSYNPRPKTPHKKKPPKMFLKRKTKEYDQNRSIFPITPKLNESTDSLKINSRFNNSARQSLSKLKNFVSSQTKKSRRKLRKSGSLKKSHKNFLQKSLYNLEKTNITQYQSPKIAKSSRNNKIDLNESIVITKKKKLIKKTQNYYIPQDIQKLHNEIFEEGIDFFEGRIINGQKQGKGKMVFLNGMIYEGNFKNNFFESSGKIIFPNGIIYKGFFKKNIFEGPGEIFLGREKIKGNFEKGIFYNEKIWVNNQNLHFLFLSKNEKDLKTGKVVIYFNNDFKINTRLVDSVIDEGKCLLEDFFGNFWNGAIYKKNNLIIFKSRGLGKNYFILDFLKGVIELVSN